MSDLFLVIPHGSGATELPLFQIAQSTKWGPAETRNSASVIGIENIEFLREKTEINTLIKSVFGIVGILLHSRTVYFLLSVPSNDTTCHIFAIKQNHSWTHTINCKLDVPHMLKNLLWPHRWKVPCERVTELCIGESLDIFTLFAVKHGMELVGHKHIRDSNAMTLEYNRILLGHNMSAKTYDAKRNWKRKESSDTNNHQISPEFWSTMKKQIIEKTNCKITSTLGVVVAIPQHITHQLNANKPATVLKGNPGYLPDNHFGVRSHNNGGRTKVKPLTVLQRVSKPTKTMSEMHVVTTVPGVFQQQHSINTVLLAVDKLNDILISHNTSDERIDKIMGAVSSSLLEDISWQLVNSPCVPHRFQSVKVDIDQVIF
jgi:hypothetical protein